MQAIYLPVKKTFWRSLVASGFFLATATAFAHAESATDNNLTIHYAIPNYVTTVNDDSNVVIYGTINIVENRDKHSGSLYKYAALRADGPYRIKEGEDIDDSNITPTNFIQLNEHKNVKEFDQYIGRYVKITGKLSSTNGGGPMLNYNSISLAKRDD